MRHRARVRDRLGDMCDTYIVPLRPRPRVRVRVSVNVRFRGRVSVRVRGNFMVQVSTRVQFRLWLGL